MRNQFCQWRVQPISARARMSPALESWALGTRSLTARLRARCGQGFSIRVVAEGWGRPEADEARRLHINERRHAWCREVVLCCDDRPLIFARSVIPAQSLRGRNRAIRVLGNRPLGELLFAGRGTRRSPIEVTRLRRDDWLTGHVQWAVPAGLVPEDGAWARRVVHYLRGRPLLVAEVFLPELTEQNEQSLSS
ncbi:MAG: chorismate lyase [Aquisalimonadaceae bacterium]